MQLPPSLPQHLPSISWWVWWDGPNWGTWWICCIAIDRYQVHHGHHSSFLTFELELDIAELVKAEHPKFSGAPAFHVVLSYSPFLIAKSSSLPPPPLSLPSPIPLSTSSNNGFFSTLVQSISNQAATSTISLPREILLKRTVGDPALLHHEKWKSQLFQNLEMPKKKTAIGLQHLSNKVTLLLPGNRCIIEACDASIWGIGSDLLVYKKSNATAKLSFGSPLEVRGRRNSENPEENGNNQGFRTSLGNRPETPRERPGGGARTPVDASLFSVYSNSDTAVLGSALETGDWFKLQERPGRRILLRRGERKLG